VRGNFGFIEILDFPAIRLGPKIPHMMVPTQIQIGPFRDHQVGAVVAIEERHRQIPAVQRLDPGLS